MGHQRWLCPGKPAASLGASLPCSQMGRCAARQGRRSRSTSDEGRADGRLRVGDAASIRSCRPCPLREQCQWQGRATKKPRQVSVLLHPLVVGPAPLLWHDWSRRRYRRACIQLLRHQRVDVQHGHDREVRAIPSPPVLSRAQRARYRLSFAERLARNARVSSASRPLITLFGVPETFSAFLGLSAT